MAGGIYTEQKCPKCGQRMEPDANLECVCCPAHKKECRAHLLFIKFGKGFKKRFSHQEPTVAYRLAHQELEAMRRAVRKGTYDRRDFEPSHPLGFANMARKYIEDREKDINSGDLKRATWVHIKADLNKAIEAFGQKNVKEVTFAELREFFRNLDRASKTRLNVRTNLHAFYQWMVSCKIIRKEEIPEIPTFKVVMGFRKTVSKDDQQRILELIKKKALACGNPRIYLAIKVLATHVNLRPGDIFEVLEEDVDLKEGVVVVTSHKTIEHTQTPKFAPVTYGDLELMRTLPRGFGKMPYFRFDTAMKGYPATSPFGKKLLRKWWKRACEELEIEGVGLYGGTRHSTARHLKRSKTVEEVKRLVGDRTNEAFNRYLEIDLDELREGAELAETSGPPSDHLKRTTPHITNRNSQETGSGREDLNLRPPAPKAGALTSLRYAPTPKTCIPYHTRVPKAM